jgi:hypothetical protein
MHHPDEQAHFYLLSIDYAIDKTFVFTAASTDLEEPGAAAPKRTRKIPNFLAIRYGPKADPVAQRQAALIRPTTGNVGAEIAEFPPRMTGFPD